MTSYPTPSSPIAFDPVYAHPLPEGHRFPMLKYELIPQALIYEGIAAPADFQSPPELDEEIVLLTHTARYWERMKGLELTGREMRAIGFPLSAKLVERELRIARGTIDCALYALAGKGIALNVAGGTHHAFADHGEGFCLLNDFAIAANYLLHLDLVKQVLIVDLDVHQGNGTAAIFEHEPRVFTWSVHGAHNYPFRKERSDLDTALPDGTDGRTYLNVITETLPALLQAIRPDIVMYLAGVDVLATDKFGKLGLSRADCLERDRIVFEACKQHGVPVCVTMGGGYSAHMRDIVAAHVNTFRLALGG